MVTRSAALRFWLTWTLASSLSLAITFSIAIFPVSIVSVLLLLSLTGRIDSTTVFPFAAALMGLAIGPVVGTFQSWLLPWARERRRRWLRRSLLGWAAGAGLGFLLIAGLESGAGLEPARSAPGGTWALYGSRTWLLQAATPVAGLVIGLVLRPVPPEPKPVLWWWLAGHVVAVAGGWMLSVVRGHPTPESPPAPSPD